MEDNQITIAGCTATLQEPSPLFGDLMLSFDARWLDTKGHAVALAWGAAALYNCWPRDKSWPVKPRPKWWGPGVDIGDYGRDIYDALYRVAVADMGRGAFNAMCYDALKFCRESSLTEAEVKAAEGFSEGRGEG